MKIGLSLSGGGYRAAAFHLGTLRKLSELKILDRINYLSTVSGGSIIGAYYCLQDEDFDIFYKKFRKLLGTSIIKRIFVSRVWLVFLLIIILHFSAIVYFTFLSYLPWLGFFFFISLLFLIVKYQFKLFPVSKVIEQIYDDLFFKGKKLIHFNPSRPEIIICSTNLETGRQFYFTPKKMSDSKYDDYYYGQNKLLFKHQYFPVSKAVMASSCVPFGFSPVQVEKKYFTDAAIKKNINPILVDGGVYDNQGIHKISHEGSQYECDIIITSDAGDKLPFQGAYNNVLTLLMRTSELFMNRIKLFQMMQNLYQNVGHNEREIAYISLGWDIEKCLTGFLNNLKNKKIARSVLKAHGLENISEPFDEIKIINKLKLSIDYNSIISNLVTEKQLKAARSISTNLTSLSDDHIESLSKHAEVMTELQVKLYCPALFR